MFLRKILSTIAAALISSEVMALLSIQNDTLAVSHKGNIILLEFLIFFIYSGAVILIYGNLVSIGMDVLQRRWFPSKNWIYVSLLGLFGLVPGILFEKLGLAIIGMLAAIIYGAFEKYLNKRVKWALVMVPAASLLLTWGYLELASPDMPPFTKAEAVQSVTKDVDTTNVSLFPKTIGKRESTINDYHVTRETSAKKMKKDVYIVTFTESWSKGTEKGSYHFSYEVGRGSLMVKGAKGDVPPYYGEAADDYKGTVVYP